MAPTRFTGTGRRIEGGYLGTHRQDFEAHRTGGDWRHDADQINVNPALTTLMGTEVQGVLESIEGALNASNTAFNDHVLGTDSRHTADQIDMNPQIGLYPFPTVQETLEEMANNPVFDDLNVNNLIAQENVSAESVTVSGDLSAENITAGTEIAADYFRGTRNNTIEWDTGGNLVIDGYADLTGYSNVTINVTVTPGSARIRFTNGEDLKNGEKIRVFLKNSTGDSNYSLLPIDTPDGSYDLIGLGDGVSPGVYFRDGEMVVLEVGMRKTGQSYVALISGSASTNLMWMEMRLSPQSVWGSSWDYDVGRLSAFHDGVSNTSVYFELGSPQPFVHVPRANKMVLNEFRIYHYTISGAAVIDPTYSLVHTEYPNGFVFDDEVVDSGNLVISPVGQSGFTANGWTPRRAELSTTTFDRFTLRINGGTGVSFRVLGVYLGFRMLPNDGTQETP